MSPDSCMLIGLRLGRPGTASDVFSVNHLRDQPALLALEGTFDGYARLCRRWERSTLGPSRNCYPWCDRCLTDINPRRNGGHFRTAHIELWRFYLLLLWSRQRINDLALFDPRHILLKIGLGWSRHRSKVYFGWRRFVYLGKYRHRSCQCD
jgi:hypothetical protein